MWDMSYVNNVASADPQIFYVEQFPLFLLLHGSSESECCMHECVAEPYDFHSVCATS